MLREWETLGKRCPVTGNPSPVVTWLKDGQPTNWTTPLSRKEAGGYTVKAEGASFVEKELQVLVMCKCPVTWVNIAFCTYVLRRLDFYTFNFCHYLKDIFCDFFVRRTFFFSNCLMDKQSSGPADVRYTDTQMLLKPGAQDVFSYKQTSVTFKPSAVHTMLIEPVTGRWIFVYITVYRVFKPVSVAT